MIRFATKNSCNLFPILNSSWSFSLNGCAAILCYKGSIRLHYNKGGNSRNSKLLLQTLTKFRSMLHRQPVSMRFLHVADHISRRSIRGDENYFNALRLQQRRSVLAGLISGTAAVLALRTGLSFVSPSASGCERGARLVARVSAEYLERCGPKDADVPFSSAAATGPTHDVEYKKRPFGILRYQGGKGAMAMEVIPTSRYPGDPQGQAFLAGVKGGR